jgi:DNA-directed RNA polymerase specialized sigma24 family protein
MQATEAYIGSEQRLEAPREEESREMLLSPPLRKAFQLRDLDGLSTSEAAQILGVAEGTVKAQLARARAKLRGLMRRALDAKSLFSYWELIVVGN